VIVPNVTSVFNHPELETRNTKHETTVEFIAQPLLDYCEKHSAPESDLLRELNRETHLRIGSPRMLSGHLQGRFLSLLSALCRPKLILEIGTYTGYSALCLAEGLESGGKLITIDPNEETNHFAQKYIDRSAYKDRITIITGQAQDIISGLENGIDLVFIDADKRNYSLYFDMVIDKVSPGGMIIADNVLWSGKVLDKQPDTDTLAITAFNKKMREDKRVSPLMLPLRDGLTLLRKTG
jgi:caffeoyl-CoA O-methyltransferase